MKINVMGLIESVKHENETREAELTTTKTEVDGVVSVVTDNPDNPDNLDNPDNPADFSVTSQHSDNPTDNPDKPSNDKASGVSVTGVIEVIDNSNSDDAVYGNNGALTQIPPEYEQFITAWYDNFQNHPAYVTTLLRVAKKIFPPKMGKSAADQMNAAIEAMRGNVVNGLTIQENDEGCYLSGTPDGSPEEVLI